MSGFPPIGPGAGGSAPEPTGWDRIQIGNWILPGRARVVKSTIGLKYDPKPASGKDGAKPTFHGVQPEEVEIEWTVWRQGDLDQADKICQQIVPSQKQKVKDLAVYVFDAAATRSIGVSAVKVVRATAWQPAPDYGVQGRRMTLHVLDWRSPPTQKGASATVTPERKVKDKAQEAARAKQNPEPAHQQQTTAPTMARQR